MGTRNKVRGFASNPTNRHRFAELTGLSQEIGAFFDCLSAPLLKRGRVLAECRRIVK